MTTPTNKKVPSLPPLRRHNGFALSWAFEARRYIENHVEGEGVSARACADVLLAIAAHVRLNEQPTARLSFDKIAEEALVSRSQTAEALKILMGLGLVRALQQERNKANIYRFCVHEVIGASPADATPPEAEAPETDENTPPPALPQPNSKPEPFDVTDYIREHQVIAGVSRKEAVAAIRWNVSERQDDDYWHTWKPKSAESLEKAVSLMLEQYRERRPKATPPKPKFAMQPAYTPREIVPVGQQQMHTDDEAA